MIPALMYLLGFGVFGFMYWLLDGVLELIIDASVHQTGDAYTYLTFMWLGTLVVYMIFGGIWMIRKYNEIEYQRY